jgi:hypothetical protein
MLIAFATLGVGRPAHATTPDFTIASNPSSVSIPLGYWAETMLTITSQNGFEGTIQLNAPVGGSTGLDGAGFSTGMTLNPDSIVNTDLQLTPGHTPGNYDLNVTATIGSISHILVIPITIYQVSGPDFTTRLWGSYSTLQDWNVPIREQEQFVSLGGFRGLVSLTATVTPNIPNAPNFSFQPRTLDLSTNTMAPYTTTVSTARTTPVGNYIVTITASSGTISHDYRAIMTVGDYRPQGEQPGPGNTTITSNSQPSGTNILSPFANASLTLSTFQSLWWLQAIIGLSIVTVLVYRRRLSFSDQ